MSKRKAQTPDPHGSGDLRLTAPGFILALDMSLTRTGYALANLTTGTISKGVLDPSPRKGMERLAYLRDQVGSLAKFGFLPGSPVPPRPRQDGPMFHPLQPIDCLVLIEGYAFGARGQAVVSLGELGGVIRLTLHDERIPYLEVPPMRVKKFLTGKGNVQKDLVLKEVFKRFGEDLDDNNVADAFALLQLGLACVGKPSRPLVGFQEQVVSDMVAGALKATLAVP